MLCCFASEKMMLKNPQTNDQLRNAIRSFFLEGPAGRLEALLNAGAENATHAAVVCHPHPVYGGTLHNKVVFHTMKALNSFGFPVLRFNFRGAGLSQGEHDHGSGEVDDVRTRTRLDGQGVSSSAHPRGILFWRRRRPADGMSRLSCKGVIALGLPVGPIDDRATTSVFCSNAPSRSCSSAAPATSLPRERNWWSY